MRFNRIQRAQASRKHGAETPVTNKATTEEEDDETVLSSLYPSPRRTKRKQKATRRKDK